ncbi:MAG TPA: hypothetical protein VIC54_03075 [Terriglobales bacterium]|jgi:antitoxin (DNA-binding transcriptional repressor) of toxin-antitoxin stability system
MRSLTASELARNLSQVLDGLQQGGEVVIERNHRRIARLVPMPAGQSALEMMGDLYRTLPDEAAAAWQSDARRGGWKAARLDAKVRDPWLS